jgi:transcriptional regulator with XRE-family HTH domain
MYENRFKLGKIILEARKKKGYTLRQCASLIVKEDNTPISFPYLSDLETGRKTPSEYMLKQLSIVLDLPIEYLYVYAETLPQGLIINADKDKVVKAFQNFIESIK